MLHCNRRRFIAQSAASAGLLTVGAAPLALAAEPKPEETQMAIAKSAAAPSPTRSAAEIDTIAGQLTRKAIEALGGMQRFVKRGDVVWIKPNMGWDRRPEQAANTNPQVVAVLVRLCLEAGAKTVKVGDKTVNAANRCYETSGIAAAVKEAGGQVVFLDDSRAKKMDIGGEKVQSLAVFPEIVECDLVLNVPIVKDHSISKLTMCMKNYMGVISERRQFHQDIPTCLADLTRFMKPRISVLDASRVLKTHGPAGGKLEDVATPLAIAAGVDIVALDAWGAEIIGRKPEDIGSVVKADKVGLGKMDYRKLALREISVS